MNQIAFAFGIDQIESQLDQIQAEIESCRNALTIAPPPKAVRYSPSDKPQRQFLWRKIREKLN